MISFDLEGKQFAPIDTRLMDALMQAHGGGGGGKHCMWQGKKLKKEVEEEGTSHISPLSGG